jgi:hypothetical protein
MQMELSLSRRDESTAKSFPKKKRKEIQEKSFNSEELIGRSSSAEEEWILRRMGRD